MTVTVDDTKLKAIADAIRAKNGTNETYKPSEMAEAIEAISGGGNIDAFIDRSITTASSDLTKIGAYSFAYCDKLTTANFPNVTTIGLQCFYKCVSLSSINFPVAQLISNNAFNGCEALETAVFPQVENIGSFAFNTCYNLKTLDFHKQTTIGTQSFANCYSLTAVILRSNTVCPLTASGLFDNSYHMLGTVNATYNPNGARGYVYVPSALINEYQAATNWSTSNVVFRALESYTVDGTITGALDESKI